MPYLALEKLHHLYDGYRKPLHIGGQHLLLVQESGNVRLLKNQCPHMGVPLTRATVVNGGLRCAQHGIEFDLRTGKAVNAPGCKERLQFLPLVYEGNTIGFEVAE